MKSQLKSFLGRKGKQEKVVDRYSFEPKQNSDTYQETEDISSPVLDIFGISNMRGTPKRVDTKSIADYNLDEESDTVGGDQTIYTTGSGYSHPSPTMSNVTSFGDTVIKGTGDIAYIKKKCGVVVVIISLLQLFLIVSELSVCSLAPIDVNIALGPYPDAVSFYGGKNTYYIITENQWWRLFSYPLTSAGIIHYIVNIIMQFELAQTAELEWGTPKFLLIYGVSTISGFILSILFKFDDITVGSTVPLMGIMGFYVAEIIGEMVYETIQDFDESAEERGISALCTLAILNLFVLFPYVDMYGLAGGFLGGLGLGLISFSRLVLMKDDKQKLLCAGIGVLFVILMPVFMIPTMQTNDFLADPCTYFESMYEDNYDCDCSA
jgi:membrane associated rhomboid family serine protease